MNVCFKLKKNGTRWAAVEECEATGATFGVTLAMNVQITACGKYTDPPDACHPVKFPGTDVLNQTDDKDCATYFALSDRGNCTFSKKVK